MGKGLKQLAAEAAAAPVEEQIHLPVHVSPEAHYALAQKVREWTGWGKRGTLILDRTQLRVSKYAECDHENKQIYADPEPLILNPNRVLLTVTPFRLRQEAVLTGTLLHEAGHARHTHWKPRTQEELTTKPLLHSDGTEPTEQAKALAQVMEEPRVEGLMFRDADRIGAVGLGWTMRASAAHLLPMTEVSADPAQAIMDLLTSWALRAGRQIAIAERSKAGRALNLYHLPGWVNRFTSLLHNTIEEHLEDRVEAGALLEDGNLPGSVESANYRSQRIVTLLRSMALCDDDTGPTMIDTARDVLTLLFPETPEDDDSDSGDGEAMPSAACGVGGVGSDEGSEGEGDTEPEDEGSGTEPGAGDQGDDEGEGQGEADSPADGGSDPEDGEAEGEGDGGSEGDASPSTPSPAQEALAQALAEMETEAKAQIDDEAEDEAEQAPPLESGGNAGGSGSGGAHGGGWRAPSSDERTIAKGAEHFLRNLIDATETSKRSLTDQPSAVVDGAALAAWKAGGQVREPHFFIRNRRNIEPSPPIKIAILVDVSSSMGVLQSPSALLSWALASAALDLRNFAGRGQQIESTLIHWGDSVRVMQKPGELLPGIREVSCNQGTSNMHGALDEVENQMPGFFDLTDRPVNRLLVQFTDWKLFHHGVAPVTERVGKALAAGVNMLSVVPNNYSARYASLQKVIENCPIQRGSNSLIKYHRDNPGAVWSQAAEMLSASAVGERPAPFPGF